MQFTGMHAGRRFVAFRIYTSGPRPLELNFASAGDEASIDQRRQRRGRLRDRTRGRSVPRLVPAHLDDSSTPAETGPYQMASPGLEPGASMSRAS